jgi:hypothetical protein
MPEPGPNPELKQPGTITWSVTSAGSLHVAPLSDEEII